MTTKAFAFEVQSSLKKATGIAIKRSHVHEVLAALFGHASYAAMTSQHVLAQHDGSLPIQKIDLAGGASRAMELGYCPPAPPLIASMTASAAKAARLYTLPLEHVLYQLGVRFDDERVPEEAHDHSTLDGPDEAEIDVDDADGDGMFFALDIRSDVLYDSLARMADGGNALAHTALVKLADETLTDLSEEGGDGAYWFRQQEAGKVLAGVELEWAEQYRSKQAVLFARQYHLKHAIALGNAEAALRQLEIDPNEENFALAAKLSGDPQAARLGHIALFLGREGDARTWLRVAARQGDTDAMKELADGLETNPQQCWTWVHLAEMFGVDLMSYQAVGDDGMPADADESGPIYAAGFDLDTLPESENAAALDAARQIYAALSGAR